MSEEQGNPQPDNQPANNQPANNQQTDNQPSNQRQKSGIVGELVKFVILIIVCVVTVFVVSATRPLIFEGVLPAVLGWTDTNPNMENELIIPAPEGTDGVEDTTLDGAEAGDESEAGTEADSPEGEGAAEEGTEDAATDGDGYPAPESDEAPAGNEQTYVVQNGDNLTRIADQFGVTIEALLEANDLSNGDLIRIGDELVIPTPSSEAYP